MSGLLLKDDDPFFASVELAWAREFLSDTPPEEFFQRYPCPALLLSLRSSGDSSAGQKPAVSDSTFLGVKNRQEPSTYGLVLVAKRPQNTLLPMMITLGRGHNVDIVLNFPTISKLHAFFYQVGNNWFLVDAESSNGTFVEGLKLSAREPYSLQAGQTIDFGYDVSSKFLTQDLLRGFLFED